METKPNGFYQTAVAGWPGQLQRKSERMDVVIGSGVRGQSYLYWHDDRRFELPVSYWSDGSRWINSPGYKDGTMNFSRAVIPRCLECHATSIVTCHRVESCGMSKTMGHKIADNCIDCHMPVESTNAIVSETAGPVPPHKPEKHRVNVSASGR